MEISNANLWNEYHHFFLKYKFLLQIFSITDDSSSHYPIINWAWEALPTFHCLKSKINTLCKIGSYEIKFKLTSEFDNENKFAFNNLRNSFYSQSKSYCGSLLLVPYWSFTNPFIWWSTLLQDVYFVD
jgi:hypothetical protein